MQFSPAPMRMRHLERESGVPRETIHFYLAEGLLPPPEKTGRTAAVYGPHHLERLRLIRDLQERYALPLRAIRAVFEGSPIKATAERRALIAGVRARLATSELAKKLGRVSLSATLEEAALEAREAREFHDLGMIEITGRGRRATVSEEDAAFLALWGRLVTTGVFREHGVEPRHAQILHDAVERLVGEEMGVFLGLYNGLPGERAARILESAVPLLNEVLGLLHTKHMRRFFEQGGQE